MLIVVFVVLLTVNKGVVIPLIERVKAFKPASTSFAVPVSVIEEVPFVRIFPFTFVPVYSSNSTVGAVWSTRTLSN